MKASASYFLGDPKNDSLQRIYGVSFPDKESMDEHLRYLEEAAKRDHRKIGKEQELFFLSRVEPGLLFLPSTWHGHLQRAALLHTVPILEAWVPRSRLAQHVQLRSLEAVRTLGPLQGRHVRVRGREGSVGAESR